ncbi:hypothetical protein NG831_06445 [Xanthomonas sacchari]|uniref:hypothetical protein n=1 Tax=Xanthomonas sacchari TaxID=56458 RepID=UPI0022558443|nr:hypothetical protein [Xanthomonas sacchari]MCW0413498.1 hypothetical protein [Xanthomonas sacchari]UYK67799.1 hypothetical protein NG831_06445 [Xanthomonas sacchari]
MEKVETRAMELLAAAYREDGRHGMARSAIDGATHLQPAIRAISEVLSLSDRLCADKREMAAEAVRWAEEAGRLKAELANLQFEAKSQGYERMFIAACAALAEVSRELGCDPDQGGAEPIIEAIQ